LAAKPLAKSPTKVTVRNATNKAATFYVAVRIASSAPRPPASNAYTLKISRR
jgi:hypothetical protein